jgi:hypothetical protein
MGAPGLLLLETWDTTTKNGCLRYITGVKRSCVLFAILAAVILAGCQYDPWAGSFLTRQPAEQDVVGFYSVDQASLQRTINLPMSRSPFKINPSAHIRLAADHKAEFFYVPKELDGLQCSVTGHGDWERMTAISSSWRKSQMRNQTVDAGTHSLQTLEMNSIYMARSRLTGYI